MSTPTKDLNTRVIKALKTSHEKQVKALSDVVTAAEKLAAALKGLGSKHTSAAVAAEAEAAVARKAAEKLDSSKLDDLIAELQSEEAEAPEEKEEEGESKKRASHKKK